MTPIDPDSLSDHDRAILATGEGAYLFPVRMPSGGISCLFRMMYTWAILHDLHLEGYEDRWCYAHPAYALAALTEWSGEDGTEPSGWHRHPFSGRRRPQGDPALETVSL